LKESMKATLLVDICLVSGSQWFLNNLDDGSCNTHPGFVMAVPHWAS
jgi:hypothetical protein